MGDDILVYEAAQGLATLTLNNPARRNSLNAQMTARLEESLIAAATDPAVRAIVITGAGPAFSSGGDIDQLKANAEAGPRAERRSAMDPSDIFPVAADTPAAYRTRYSFAMAIPKPVIAAVNGPAVGAGFLLALHCDIRFASPAASFAAGFARIGATPEMAMSWTLPRVIGMGRAREMLLSGRRVPADEALQMGLVNRVIAPEALMAETVAYARELAANISPRSVEVIKRQLRHVFEQSFAEAFEEAAVDARESLAGPDFQEGLAAFRERRPPRFTG